MVSKDFFFLLFSISRHKIFWLKKQQDSDEGRSSIKDFNAWVLETIRLHALKLKGKETSSCRELLFFVDFNDQLGPARHHKSNDELNA